MRKLTKSQVKKIRAAYCAGDPVSSICHQYRISQSTTYSILNNQEYHDPEYQPTIRPKEVLLDVGAVEIGRWRSEGSSWCRISRLIEAETGHFVRAERIRCWYRDQSKSWAAAS